MGSGVRPGRSEPLWTRIERNGPKLAFYVGAFLLAWTLAAEVIVVLPVALLVSWWGPRYGGEPGPFLAVMSWGAVAVLGLGALWSAFACTRSERSILAQLGAVRVPTGELAETKSVLHDMSLAVGLEYPPPLYVVDSTSLNAFVVGRRASSAAVGVTRGLLKRLDPDEQRAVFANLLTRFGDGDILVATVVSSLMAPEWAWRRAVFSGRHDAIAEALAEAGRARPVWPGSSARADAGSFILFVLAFWVIAVFVLEFLYFGQMQQQILAGEAADAKGMLLLKDPRCMLSALEEVLPADNTVPAAGAALAPLFFAWTGDAYNDERDPEVRRAARLREVLGADGVAEEAGSATGGDDVFPPPAPRLERDADA